eukprot:COSAG04_NODE_11238_length_721_cov_1.323151_1_plen_122_part_01
MIFVLGFCLIPAAGLVCCATVIWDLCKSGVEEIGTCLSGVEEICTEAQEEISTKRRKRIGVGDLASAATSHTSKRGALRKLGGKQHDQWQPVEVELSASGLSWTSGSASRDRLAGSQKTLTP